MKLKKVTFGGLTYDHDASFEYFDIFVDNEYVGFVEKVYDSFVFLVQEKLLKWLLTKWSAGV